MAKLVVPELDILRDWLEQLNIAYFECDACDALHLPHIQSTEGVFDAKIDLVETSIVFSAIAEICLTGLLPLVADLSQINASTLDAKIFVDIQDNHSPKLVICQTFPAGSGIAFEQFSYFLQIAEEQTLQIMAEAYENGLLVSPESDDDLSPYISSIHPLH